MGDYTPPPTVEEPPAVVIEVGAELETNPVEVGSNTNVEVGEEGNNGAVQAVQEGQLVGNQEEEGEAEGTASVGAGVEVPQDPILEVGLGSEGDCAEA